MRIASHPSGGQLRSTPDPARGTPSRPSTVRRTARLRRPPPRPPPAGPAAQAEDPAARPAAPLSLPAIQGGGHVHPEIFAEDTRQAEVAALVGRTADGSAAGRALTDGSRAGGGALAAGNGCTDVRAGVADCRAGSSVPGPRPAPSRRPPAPALPPRTPRLLCCAHPACHVPAAAVPPESRLWPVPASRSIRPRAERVRRRTASHRAGRPAPDARRSPGRRRGPVRPPGRMPGGPPPYCPVAAPLPAVEPSRPPRHRPRRPAARRSVRVQGRRAAALPPTRSCRLSPPGCL